MKKQLSKKTVAKQTKANTIMYMVQDMFDDMSRQYATALKRFEKEVLDIICDDDINWDSNLPAKKPTEKK